MRSTFIENELLAVASALLVALIYFLIFKNTFDLSAALIIFFGFWIIFNQISNYNIIYKIARYLNVGVEDVRNKK